MSRKKKIKNPCETCDKSIKILEGGCTPNFIYHEECSKCEDYAKYDKYLDSVIFSKKNMKEYERVMYCIEHCIDTESEG